MSPRSVQGSAIAAQASPNGNAMIMMMRNSRYSYRETKLLDCTY